MIFLPAFLILVRGFTAERGSQAALQVRSKDRWTALLLLSPPEDERELN